MEMTSNKPYLIRAIYDWIVDNDLTPYLGVNAEYPGVELPNEHVHDGRIVLNISPKATRGLVLKNERIVFTARFDGDALQICVPPEAVIEIFAQENGKGILFEIEQAPLPAARIEKSDLAPSVAKTKKPNLKLVTKNSDE